MKRFSVRMTGGHRRAPGRRRRRRDAGLAGLERLETRHALTGTPSLVGDINTEPVGALADHAVTLYTPSYAYSGTKAPEFVSFAGRTFFPADDGIHGLELWVSDGTPAGTSLLVDINQTRNDFAGGAAGSEPADFFVVGDTLYFSADDGVHGNELWKTDGTAAGTVLVKDIAQTPTPLTYSHPHSFASLADGTVLFVANDGGGETIWKTDGTEAGTVRLDEGWATPLDSGYSIGSVTSLGAAVLFDYRTGQFDPQTLWITDGTEANTRQLLSSTGEPVASPTGFVTVTETVTPPEGFGPATSTQVAYFTAAGGIWRSDGTPAGTFQLANASYNGERSLPVPFGTFSRPQTEFPYGTVTGPRIVFAGDDGVSGTELWVSDGTAAGTVRRADINPAVNATTGEGIGSGPARFVAAGSTLYFSADDGVAGRELWAFDGTSVFQVADIAPGAISSNPVLLGAVGSTLYLSADDGVVGRELWKTDGLTTALVGDIRPGSAASFVNRIDQSSLSAAVRGDGLLFAADDGQHGVELWTTDGTAAGTALVADINTMTADGVVATDGSGTFIGAAVIDGTVYFPATDGGHGTELWKRSGDAAPELVADISPGIASSNLSQFTVSGGKLFFTVGVPSPQFIYSLWVSDGTAAGTFPLAEQVRSSQGASSVSSATRYLAPFGGGVFFAAADATHGSELWFTDGTAAGTALFLDIADDGATAGPNGDSTPEWFARLGDELFFVANGAGGDRQIWKTDGTVAGTVPVTSLPTNASPTNLAAFGGSIVFAAADAGGDVELWKTDGSTTELIADINPTGSSNPSRFVAVGGLLYFIADDGSSGRELWVTDGTAGGTQRLVDINPGTGAGFVGANSNGLVPMVGVGTLGAGVVFSAYDGGRESLWVSDGTPAGTAPLPLPDGVGSGSPGNIVVADGRLYFTADIGGGRVLYESEGTAESGRVVELAVGDAGARVAAIAATADRLVFVADDGVHGSEAWQLPFAAAPPPDTVAPTVGISSTTTTLQPGGQATITFTVSEAGTGFTGANVQVTGGTLTGFAGDGTTFTALLTADAATTAVSISVAAGGFNDAAGNPNDASALQIPVAPDTVAPTVEISSTATTLKAGEQATITFTLSEPSSDFTAADVLATLGTLTGFAQQSALVYTATFTPDAGVAGLASITVAPGSFTDGAGNANIGGASLQITVDTIAPTVAISADTTTIIAGSSTGVTFTVSEAGTGFTAANVQVTGGTLTGFTGDGTTFTALFTVDASATAASIAVPAGAFTNAAGKPNDGATQLFFVLPNFLVDTTPPTVSITSTATTLQQGGQATITFTVSEAGTGFTAANVQVTGGALTGFTGVGTTFTAVFTAGASATTASISVAAGAFTDAAGNPNDAAALQIPLTPDTTPPSVSISMVSTIVPSGQSATVTFTLSEPVASFNPALVEVQVGTLTGFTGAGTTFTATYTAGPLPAIVFLTVKAGAFVDAAGNPNAEEVLPITIADAMPPTVAITTSGGTAVTLLGGGTATLLAVGETATVTFELSEESADFSEAVIGLFKGTLTGFHKVSATTYEATFVPVPGTRGDAEVYLTPGAFTDLSGNPSANGASRLFLVDVTRPTVTISSSVAPGGMLGSGQTATFTFTLGAPSTTFDANDVAVVGGMLTGFSGSGTSYAATFKPQPGYEGPASVTVAADSFSGTTLAGLGNAAAVLAPAFQVDTVPPTVTITATATALKAGEQATITFTLSEPAGDFTAADVLATLGTLTGFAQQSALVYTATFTPDAGVAGVGSITVPPGSFADGAGNANVVGPSLQLDVNTIAPVVSITSSAAALRAGQTATISFLLPAVASGFTDADIQVGGGTLSPLQPSPMVGDGPGVIRLAATFTPFADSTVPGTITVPAAAFGDLSGNASEAGALLPPIQIDTRLPAVTITSGASTVFAGASTTITFTLSEPSPDFTAAAVDVVRGSLTGFAAVAGTAGLVYTATFTADPSVPSLDVGTVSVPAGRFTDQAGNPNVAGGVVISIDGYGGGGSYDFLPPAVTIATTRQGLGLGQSALLTFTLSELCAGFSAAAVSVSAGTIADFAGSGLVFTATYTPPPDFGGPVTVGVQPGAFTDFAGNPNLASQLGLDVNTIVPTVALSATIQPGPGVAAGGTATLRFTLSEPSADFDAGDVQVTGGTIANFAGSGVSYSATFTPFADFTGIGTVTVPAAAFSGVPRGPVAGNANVAATLAPALAIDTRAPTITLASSRPTLGVGQTATIAFTLSEPAAAFTLAGIEAVGGTLSALSGSGTTYTALFTPQPGYLGTGEVKVAAGGFSDVAGNPNRQPAAVTLVIDTQQPTAIGATAIPAGHYKAGTVLGFTVGFTEPVTVVGTPRIPLQIGGGGRHAVYAGSPDGLTLRFAYTVQAGDNTPVGDRTGPRVAGMIDLAGGSIRDGFGNDAVTAIPAAAATDVVVDTVAPTVVVTSSQPLLGAGKTALMTFTLSEPSNDFGPGSVTATGGTLSGFTGSGTVRTAVFTPRPNLTGDAVVTVDVGRFTDLAGNADDATATRSTAVDTSLRFAAGTDGQAIVWDREFAYRATSGTTIRLPLPASQAAYFTPRTVLSITPSGAAESIVAVVKSRRYDAATRTVVVTLDRQVPATKTAGSGTLVLGGIVPPGARLLAGVNGVVVHDYGAAELLQAGYSPAFVTRFQGGLRTAAADLDDNGFADLIVAPGGVPNLPDPLAPGRRLADGFGDSLRTVAIFDGSPAPAWAPVKLDVGPVLGVASQGGFQVTTGDVVSDAAGSGTLELIVASGTRLAVYEVRVAAPGARPSIDPQPIRVVDLGAGQTAAGVAAGRLFAADPFDDVIVAATTATGRVAGTTSVSILAGPELGVVRSFPVTCQVESGPSRRLVDVFGFGASLAVGDVDGNGANDLVLGAGAGGLGNFRVLANEFVTGDPSQPSFAATIATQLGPAGRFAQYRAPTQAWRPTGGPDYFTPGVVIGPTGQGFNAPVSVRVVNVSTTGSPRAEVFAALGAANQTANTVKRFLFEAPGTWTSAAAFDLLSASASDMRFRRGTGVRLG